MSNYFIGIMSGTSFDAVDAVIVSLQGNKLDVIAHLTNPYPHALRSAVLRLSEPGPHPLEDLCQVDVKLGELYAETTLDLLKKANMASKDIRAIGLHGQTIRHYPSFTSQIGDPNTVVARTGITTVCDFRRGDMARGGQGAPLAPAFHRAYFYNPEEQRVVLNIGGFSNITLLPREGSVSGFDTGPGNVLMDAYMQHYCDKPYDEYGDLASSGQVHEKFLAQLLAHPYFAKPSPKSTGRDEFRLNLIQDLLASDDLTAADAMATLTELTARSVAEAILKVQPDSNRLFVCGGGADNRYLMSRLAALLPGVTCSTTESIGLSHKLVEPCLMAWLAQQTLDKNAVDLRPITGSDKPAILGGVYFA